MATNRKFGRMLQQEKKGCMPVVLFAILIGASALLSACGASRGHLNTVAAVDSASKVRIAKMRAEAVADSTERAIATAARIQKEQEKVTVARLEAERDSIRRASRNASRPTSSNMPVASVSWRLTTEMEDGRITDRVTDSSGYAMTDKARKHEEEMANIRRRENVRVAKQLRIAANPCGGIRYWLPECPPMYGGMTMSGGSSMIIGRQGYGVNGVSYNTVPTYNQPQGSGVGGTNGVGRGTVPTPPDD